MDPEDITAEALAKNNVTLRGVAVDAALHVRRCLAEICRAHHREETRLRYELPAIAPQNLQDCLYSEIIRELETRGFRVRIALRAYPVYILVDWSKPIVSQASFLANRAI